MGTAERKIREKEKRKKEILKCAERLFSSKKGMESTMDDLAQKTELGKGTLYLYSPIKKAFCLLFVSPQNPSGTSARTKGDQSIRDH